jgi:hypothetical protein
MKNNLWFKVIQKFSYQSEISNVGDVMLHTLSHPGKVEKRGVGRGGQCDPLQVRAQRLQPKAQPTAFKTSMPCNEYMSPPPKI